MNYLRELRHGDLEYLAENLREADKQEVLVTHASTLAALQASVELSYLVNIVEVEDSPIAIFGLAKIDDKTDSIWMLATDGLLKHSREFLRQSKTMIRTLFDLSGADTFTNYVYYKNTVHQKWLSWCLADFKRRDFILVGEAQEMFFPFFIQREKYV